MLASDSDNNRLAVAISITCHSSRDTNISGFGATSGACMLAIGDSGNGMISAHIRRVHGRHQCIDLKKRAP